MAEEKNQARKKNFHVAGPAPEPGKLRGLLGPIKDNSATFDVLGTAGVMGLHMVSGPVAGGGLGWLLDKFLGTWPWCAAIGLLLGIISGFYNVWLDTKRILRQQDKMDKTAPKKDTQAHPAPAKAARVLASEDLPEARAGRSNPHRPKAAEYTHDDPEDVFKDLEGMPEDAQAASKTPRNNGEKHA